MFLACCNFDIFCYKYIREGGSYFYHIPRICDIFRSLDSRRECHLILNMSRAVATYLFLIHMRELEEGLLLLYLFHHINIEQITNELWFHSSTFYTHRNIIIFHISFILCLTHSRLEIIFLDISVFALFVALQSSSKDRHKLTNLLNRNLEKQIGSINNRDMWWLWWFISYIGIKSRV